jgi:hypothetical protein
MGGAIHYLSWLAALSQVWFPQGTFPSSHWWNPTDMTKCPISEEDLPHPTQPCLPSEAELFKRCSVGHEI